MTWLPLIAPSSDSTTIINYCRRPQQVPNAYWILCGWYDMMLIGNPFKHNDSSAPWYFERCPAVNNYSRDGIKSDNSMTPRASTRDSWNWNAGVTHWPQEQVSPDHENDPNRHAHLEHVIFPWCSDVFFTHEGASLKNTLLHCEPAWGGSLPLEPASRSEADFVVSLPWFPFTLSSPWSI